MAIALKQRTRKPWYRSRVLWVNVVAVVLLAAEMQIGVLQGVLPGTVYQWAAFVLPIINALMRMRHMTLRDMARGEQRSQPYPHQAQPPHQGDGP